MTSPSVAIKPLLPAQLTVIEGSLATVTPGGGTPIVGATILAYQHLHAMALDCERPNVVYSPDDASAPQVIAQEARAACDAGVNGLQYAEDGTKILLCGATCETVRNDRGSRVDVVLGCPVQGPQ